MENDVRKPKDGYRTETKRKYRCDVWDCIMSKISFPEKAKALILPSYHDEEIKVAISHGIKEENIYACDENAAMLATAEWRKKYPKVNILGNRLSRAIERLNEKNIKLDIANLDLCTNLQQWMFKDVLSVLAYLLGDKITLGLTLLKGREATSETTLARMLFTDIKGAVDRIKIVSEFINQKTATHHIVCKNSEYKSGNQMMVYGVYDIISNREKNKHIVAPYIKYAKDIQATLEIDNEFYRLSIPRGGAHEDYASCGGYASYYEKMEKILDDYWRKANNIRRLIEAETMNDKYAKYVNPRNDVRLLLDEYTHMVDFNTMINMPYHRI